MTWVNNLETTVGNRRPRIISSYVIPFVLDAHGAYQSRTHKRPKVQSKIRKKETETTHSSKASTRQKRSRVFAKSAQFISGSPPEALESGPPTLVSAIECIPCADLVPLKESAAQTWDTSLLVFGVEGDLFTIYYCGVCEIEDVIVTWTKTCQLLLLLLLLFLHILVTSILCFLPFTTTIVHKTGNTKK